MDYSLIADLYDSYVQTSLDIPFFLGETRDVKGEVLELMAGTGRVSIPLLEQGVRLTCVDLFAEMLDVLRAKAEERGFTPRLVQMDVTKLDLGQQYEMILLPFNSFAEIAAPEDQRLALAGIYRHLRDKGVFILTAHNPAVRTKRMDGQLRLWNSATLCDRPGKLLLWGLENYEPGTNMGHGLQLIEEYDSKGVLQAKRMVETRFVLHEKDALEGLAAGAGFRVLDLFGDYGRSPFNPESSPFMIWRLGK